jgi:7,8-dihydropterin-6-yl-methyl-4-(beta-D-ribofuranosyl)aminobenzene 5'-phosphate synthase
MSRKSLWIATAFLVFLGSPTLCNGAASKEHIMHGQLNNDKEKKSIKITVIYDNNPYKEGIETAWGFSCLIRIRDKTILFDTGGDGRRLLTNMERLRISPSDISLIVLSHIHGDHVGGLGALLERNRNVMVYIPASFPEGFKEEVQGYGAKIVEVRKTIRICEGVYSTGELGTWIKEQALVIGTGRGTIVVTGCSHPGVVNMVKKAKEIIPGDVLFVIGGYHLGGKNSGEIEHILSEFRNLGVRNAGPCHCTGTAATEMFKRAYGKNFIRVGAGRVITLSDLK